jgi:DNA polymerase-3 subunit epsilon
MSLIKAKLKNTLLQARLRNKNLPPLARQNLEALKDLDMRQPARTLSYVVVDLETTGLDVRADRVLSVGAVRIGQGRVRLGDNFVEMVNPGRSIPVESIRVHGIKPDQVHGARRAAQVFEDFLTYLGTDIVVAHYARFDMHFINATMHGLYGFPLQNPVMDTVRMCESLVLPSDPYGVGRNQKKCSLDSLCAQFGITTEERHTAMGDALATAIIFLRMLKRLEDAGSGTLRDLWRLAALD